MGFHSCGPRYSWYPTPHSSTSGGLAQGPTQWAPYLLLPATAQSIPRAWSHCGVWVPYEWGLQVGKPESGEGGASADGVTRKRGGRRAREGRRPVGEGS